MADLFKVVLRKVDDSFSVQETRNYGLYMQVNESSLTYAILDLKRNKFLALQQMKKSELQPRPSPAPPVTFNDFLKSMMNASPWLKNPYKQVKIAYEGNKATLIPLPLFDSTETENYLKLNFQMTPEETILTDHLIPFDNYQVFSIPLSTLNSIKAFFPSSRINHLSSVLMESIWINYKNRVMANRVFICIREKYFDLMIYDSRQMIYFNSFPAIAAEDIAYYLIFVLEQLSLNPESSHTVLLGAVEKNSRLFELLFRYMRHVEFGRRSEAFKYAYVFNQISPHAFFPLLNYPSCGL